MRTVGSLIKELEKFPPQAECFGYEGEATGVSITFEDKFGFIYCSGSSQPEPQTEEFN